jgi:hypothetical protein
LETVSVSVCKVNVAVTDLAASTVTTQVPVPEQPEPLQPVKSEPVAGVAVSVTEVPYVYELEQVAPQLIPAGLDVTVPLPLPFLVTDRPKLSSE